jgi:uncharacterized protein (TIGR02246 family)
MRFFTPVAAMMIAFVAGCAHSAPATLDQRDLDAARAGIGAQHDAWRDAIIAGDAAALAALFVEDGVLLALDGSVAKGRSEVERQLRDALRRSRYLRGGIQIEQLDLRGELAIEIARFEWDRSLDGGPPTGLQKGHAMAVWQRNRDGRWLLRAWSAKYDPQPR